jgi:hypothetical protein
VLLLYTMCIEREFYACPTHCIWAFVGVDGSGLRVTCKIILDIFIELESQHHGLKVFGLCSLFFLLG